MGITNGTSSTTFSPNAACTRGQVVTFLWRAEGTPAETMTTQNSTIVYITKTGTKYHNAGCKHLRNSKIAIELSEAIKKGYTACEDCNAPKSAPTPKPTPAPTPKPTPAPTPQPPHQTIPGFGDVYVDDYYAEAVKWAVSNGVTNGTAPGQFSPNNPCTRAQIVTFLYRAVI